MSTPLLKFISLEGGEAVGKSTQIERLAKRLKDLGQKVIITREPGGTPLCESIRHLLKHAPEGRGMTPYTELLLFIASRAELVRKVIMPALDQGTGCSATAFSIRPRSTRARAVSCRRRSSSE